MINLIKADCYRQLKQGKMYLYVIGILSIFNVGLILNGIEPGTDIKATDLYTVVLTQQNILILIVIMGVIAFILGQLFPNKYIHMQVIASKDRYKVMLSKYIVQCVISVIMATVEILLVMGLLSIFCHVDYSSVGQLFLKWGLLLILIVRFTITMISIVFIAKNGLLAAMLNWFIMLGEMVPQIIGKSGDSKIGEYLMQIFTVDQMNMIARNAVDMDMVVKILLASVVEIVIVMVIGNLCFRKTELL